MQTDLDLHPGIGPIVSWRVFSERRPQERTLYIRAIILSIIL